MEPILQQFNADPVQPGQHPKPEQQDNPAKKEEQIPAPERQPRIQPPEVDDPKAIPSKEFDPDYTEQPELDLPQHEAEQKGYAEVPREDILPEFNNNAKDRGNSAESSGDPASAFAEK